MPDLNLGTQRGFGQVGAVVQLLGDPEIADLDVLVLVEQNVLGFDVTGPYPKSAEGFAYCLDVICYYSGKNWSIPIRLKAEAYGAAKSLLTKMQNADRPPEGVEI